MRNKKGRLSKKKRFYTTLVMLFLITTILTVKASGLKVNSGDVFWWETGDSKSVTGYIRLTYQEVRNATVWVDYLGYDIVGELTANITNKSAGFLWVDPGIFSEWSQLGYEKINITHLDIQFQCIIRERIYGEETTDEYYDLDSGILVKSESNLGNYKTLISTEDINLETYMKEHNKTIDSLSLIWLIGVISCTMVYLLLNLDLRNKRKK
ncbi:MAG: hypothetical protein K9W44_18520 [Candidatus Lokiarchaeota archaeon]|nr:hypothetical protein [Candidatus Harpocratesius repetitus]